MRPRYLASTLTALVWLGAPCLAQSVSASEAAGLVESDKPDANADGSLSALEQQDWANNLPTRDDTLANPVRFDPNLDRIVNVTEFVTVVAQLTLDHADPDGNIYLSKLAAPEPKDPDKRLWSDANDREFPTRR